MGSSHAFLAGGTGKLANEYKNLKWLYHTSNSWDTATSTLETNMFIHSSWLSGGHIMQVKQVNHHPLDHFEKKHLGAPNGL